MNQRFDCRESLLKPEEIFINMNPHSNIGAKMMVNCSLHSYSNIPRDHQRGRWNRDGRKSHMRCAVLEAACRIEELCDV